MKIKPTKSVLLPEKISVFEASGLHEQYIIDSKSGNYYVLGKECSLKNTFSTPWKRSQLSAIHPKEPMVAIMEENILHIVDLKGHELWQKEGKHIAASWNLEGSFLFTILRIDSNRLNLIIYDNFGEVTVEKNFKDELYESAAHLTTIPNSRDMVLQLLAGQDGCSTYFVSQNGKNIEMRILHERYSYTCLSFNRTGTGFLCIENDESTIHHFTYPELVHTGVYDFYEECDEECNLEYSLIHLGENAIISYGENYYFLNIDTMKVIDTVIIEGHEPVPTNSIYKNLKDTNLICDIAYLVDAGRYIFACVNKRRANEIVVIDKEMYECSL